MKKLCMAFFAIAFTASAVSQQLPPRPPRPPHPPGLRPPPEPPRPKTPGEVANDVKHFFRGDRATVHRMSVRRHHTVWHKRRRRHW